MVFEMPPHILYRIEFRSIRWQPFDENAPSGGVNEAFDQHTAMNRRSIPQNHHFPWYVPLEVSEKLNDLGALDAAGVHLKVEPPQSQATNDRKALPVEGFVEHWGLSTRRPGADPCRARAQSAFVYEHDDSPLLARLFFKAGHATRFQWRMAFSSRSTARRSGRWQLKPLAPSRRQTCPG